MALAGGDSAFATLDEPFRGTNVHDAADATVAVIQRLVENSSAVVFLASHIAAVAPWLEADPRVCMLHVSADMSTTKPTFDYTVRQGVSAQRLGMTLLEQEGVLDLLEHRWPSVT